MAERQRPVWMALNDVRHLIMTHAVLRLVLITIGTLILGFFAVILVRQMGLQQQYASPSHKWFELKDWNVVTPTAEKLCSSQFSTSETEIAALPIRYNGTVWIVDCPDKNQTLSLKDYLAKSAAVNVLLQVHSGETQNLDNLVESVGSFDKTKNFGISASAQKVSRALRKKAPQWLYAADAASFLRFQIFTGMWIETAMDFWPDFVIAGQDEETQDSHFTPRLVNELQRRHKHIIWANEKAKPSFPVQGTLTQR